jgi:hypothetical protein
MTLVLLFESHRCIFQSAQLQFRPPDSDASFFLREAVIHSAFFRPDLTANHLDELTIRDRPGNRTFLG